MSRKEKRIATPVCGPVRNDGAVGAAGVGNDLVSVPKNGGSKPPPYGDAAILIYAKS